MTKMSTLMRSLRVQRNELKKLVDAKPQLKLRFASADELDTYADTLESYKNELSMQRQTFYDLHKQMLQLSGVNDADQKTLEETAETDANLLIQTDKAVVQTMTFFDQLTRKRKENLEKFRFETSMTQANEPRAKTFLIPPSCFCFYCA